MDDINEPLRKCDKCKITKPKKLFYKYKYCNRCHIKNYIRLHLQNARIANHLNISIDELNNILKIDFNDSNKNEIGEHQRYDEVMLLMYNSSSIITDDIINNFLDEPL
jgi:hypothetical protein